MWSIKSQPTFRRNMSPPSSGLKNNLSKNQPEAGHSTCLILLHLSFPSGSFLLAFSLSSLCILLPHACSMPCPSHPLFDHSNYIWQRIQFSKLIMQFSSPFCYFIPLRPKYSPQHPVTKHSQCILFPYCKRPSFIPI
jgi:hypothetical protein